MPRYVIETVEPLPKDDQNEIIPFANTPLFQKTVFGVSVEQMFGAAITGLVSGLVIGWVVKDR